MLVRKKANSKNTGPTKKGNAKHETKLRKATPLCVSSGYTASTPKRRRRKGHIGQLKKRQERKTTATRTKNEEGKKKRECWRRECEKKNPVFRNRPLQRLQSLAKRIYRPFFGIWKRPTGTRLLNDWLPIPKSVKHGQLCGPNPLPVTAPPNDWPCITLALNCAAPALCLLVKWTPFSRCAILSFS